jgi:hypothetical protein
MPHALISNLQKEKTCIRRQGKEQDAVGGESEQIYKTTLD